VERRSPPERVHDATLAFLLWLLLLFWLLERGYNLYRALRVDEGVVVVINLAGRWDSTQCAGRHVSTMEEAR
jgi:hypothetical protein